MGDEVFKLEMLTRDWADKKVTKDPPRWDGDSYAGLKYSECPAEYLEELASFLQWKVNKDKEKEANGEKLQLQTRGKDAGKPWYVRDEFEAKLIRTWAASKRRASKPVPAKQALPKRPPTPPTPAWPEQNFADDDEIPF